MPMAARPGPQGHRTSSTQRANRPRSRPIVTSACWSSHTLRDGRPYHQSRDETRRLTAVQRPTTKADIRGRLDQTEDRQQLETGSFTWRGSGPGSTMTTPLVTDATGAIGSHAI